MEYLIGIDGGGSKTKFICFDVSGRLIAETLTGTTDYHEIGIGGVTQRLKDGLSKLNVNLQSSLIGFGMPAYGENEVDDEKAVLEIKKALSDTRIHIENDVTCAWAGALALSPGVTVVCGTGSMSVGRDKLGNMARSGGWCEFFSDEGSGYWLGKKALELFSKQSDYRLPRGPLYSIIKKHLKIEKDFDIISIINSDYAYSRKQIASLQMLLFQSWRQGDETTKAVYEQAVSEVALTTVGVVRQLEFDDIIDVSYVGGLFCDKKELILDPFIEEINKHFQAKVYPPKLTPCHGAVLLALEEFEKRKLKKIKSDFLKNI